MDKNKKILAYIKFIFLACIIIGVPLALYLKFGSEFFSKDFVYDLEAYLRSHRSGAAWTLIGLQIFQVIVCIIPGQPIQFAASYIFGIVRGLLISLIGAVIGAAISFCLAKVLGRDFLYVLFDKDKLDDYQRKLNSGKGLMFVLLIYLLPGVPKDLVSYAAGISGMKLRPFLLVSTVGRTPGMMGSLLTGHFLGTRNYAAIAILAVLMALILIICFIKRQALLDLLDRVEAKEKG
ncbi:MAG: TVP38/TMEM64 family protein [Mogibacterium sp.]|nr:TVP38/TMEM64 family protein [Mogibacterium sp.]